MVADLHLHLLAHALAHYVGKHFGVMLKALVGFNLLF